MEKTNTERKLEQLLKDEREKLLSEVHETILRKKAMTVDPEEAYYRKRYFDYYVLAFWIKGFICYFR
jgi:hypothetical protein